MANKRKQGEGTMRLRTDGRWEGRIVVGYHENGNPKTKSVTAKTKYECEEKLKALKEDLGRTAQRIKPEMPFGEWMDYWYQNFCRPALRETTQASYESSIYAHIIPAIGQIPLNKLTQTDLQQFYANLKKNGRLQYSDTCGKGVSDRLVRACHARCRQAIEKAITENLITRDPSIGCKLPPKKSKEMQVLTPGEITRFLSRAKEEGYYELFLLELSTGMRRGELLGLKWNDINFSNGSLKITREVVTAGDQILVQSPKTRNSVRTVVLPPYMVEILAEMKKEKTCEWIFPSPVRAGEPRNPTALHHRFKLILERSGCKSIRFHDLRHTFATMALENGMNVKVLSDMIGHISTETTLNIYSHITDTMRAQAAVRIDREIGGTDAPMPEAKDEPQKEQTNRSDEDFKPYTPKVRRSGTGCIYQISDSLWEGSFYPRLPDGKRKKFNVYAKTEEECEKKLAEMIAEKKAEIAEMKKSKSAE
ncbi:MAG: site-specific integrase, partial [Lachnospiraceae bacterium]|nr:site-specific integrase [Lachnospiraceae bacterium]